MARPRSDEARRKALEAAQGPDRRQRRRQPDDRGGGGRSGVAKTTIYRHWPERTSLIVDTVNASSSTSARPTPVRCGATSSVLRRGHAHRPVRQRRPDHALPHRGGRPRSGDGVLLERIGSERDRVCRTIVERRSARGEIARGADLDIEHARRGHRRTDRLPEDGAPPPAHARVRRTPASTSSSPA